MTRFARIDSQIRVNRLIFSNRFRVPELNPLFCESCFGGQKIANRRFEAVLANPSHYEIEVFSRKSIRVNRPDSRCESPGHLSRAAIASMIRTNLIVRSGVFCQRGSFFVSTRPASCSLAPMFGYLRWAKSRDSYRRIASESYRCDSNR